MRSWKVIKWVNSDELKQTREKLDQLTKEIHEILLEMEAQMIELDFTDERIYEEIREEFLRSVKLAIEG